MFADQLPVFFRGVPGPLVSGVALHDRPLDRFDHRTQELRAQEVLIPLFSGMDLHRHLSGQSDSEGPFHADHGLGGDPRREIDSGRLPFLPVSDDTGQKLSHRKECGSRQRTFEKISSIHISTILSTIRLEHVPFFPSHGGTVNLRVAVSQVFSGKIIVFSSGGASRGPPGT